MMVAHVPRYCTLHAPPPGTVPGTLPAPLPADDSRWCAPLPLYLAPNPGAPRLIMSLLGTVPLYPVAPPYLYTSDGACVCSLCVCVFVRV